ncbi:PRL-1 [Strongyloides ratti]|uniref:protein-tyrosine-phosphatase n=1 Tax=Strongyloides ratti TaxID=34506 RepID=A0A090LL57_STRRB|nr:PRL-1 [Strongyloides ratti]CEF68908.1 PRL-1 [Strongyloides ratti]
MGSDTLVMIPPKSISPSSSTQLCQFIIPTSSLIQYGQMNFLITDRPNEQNMDTFIRELEYYGAKIIVRVCEQTYPIFPLTSHGISVINWEYPDGAPPPPDVIAKWIDLVKRTFKNLHSSLPINQEDNDCKNEGKLPACIAIHCVAGLGRAPVLVAIALMEAGVGYEETILTIRQKRRGAFNQRQLDFLKSYKSTGQLTSLALPLKVKPEKYCGIM